MNRRLPSPEPGAIFGDLRVLIPDARTKADKQGKKWRALWCLCNNCGKTKVIPFHRIVRKGQTHCGCKHSTLKHGFSKTPTHNSWSQMRDRCNNSKLPGYKRYGGRGIKVCERWNKFENFLADMGERPEGTSLDRIDNDGNYEPGNCRWATWEEQANNRSNNRYITFKNETLTVTQWAKKLNIQRPTILYRLDYGWTVEKALTTPVRPRAH